MNQKNMIFSLSSVFFLHSSSSHMEGFKCVDRAVFKTNISAYLSARSLTLRVEHFVLFFFRLEFHNFFFCFFARSLRSLDFMLFDKNKEEVHLWQHYVCFSPITFLPHLFRSMWVCVNVDSLFISFLYACLHVFIHSATGIERQFQYWLYTRAECEIMWWKFKNCTSFGSLVGVVLLLLLLAVRSSSAQHCSLVQIDDDDDNDNDDDYL